jgi:hypothetical protein
VGRPPDREERIRGIRQRAESESEEIGGLLNDSGDFEVSPHVNESRRGHSGSPSNDYQVTVERPQVARYESRSGPYDDSLMRPEMDLARVTPKADRRGPPAFIPSGMAFPLFEDTFGKRNTFLKKLTEPPGVVPIDRDQAFRQRDQEMRVARDTGVTGRTSQRERGGLLSR